MRLVFTTVLFLTPTMASAQVFSGTTAPQELPAPVFNGGGFSGPEPLPPPIYGGGSTFQPLPAPIYNSQPHFQYQPPNNFNGSGYVEPLPSPQFNTPSNQQFQTPMFNNYQQNQAPPPSPGATYWDPISRTYLDNSPTGDGNYKYVPAQPAQTYRSNTNVGLMPVQGSNNYQQNQAPPPSPGATYWDPISRTYLDNSPTGDGNYNYVPAQPAQTYRSNTNVGIVPVQASNAYVPNRPPVANSSTYQPASRFTIGQQPVQTRSFSDNVQACWNGPSGCVTAVKDGLQFHKNSTNNVAYQATSVVGGVLGGVALVTSAPAIGTVGGIAGIAKEVYDIFGAAQSANAISNYFSRR